MKQGDMLLNWRKKPVAMYLGDNRVCYLFNDASIKKMSDKQMKAFFYSEGGLVNADLSETRLTLNDFSKVNMEGVDLCCSLLSHCTLVGTNLSYSYLRNTYLNGADLSESNLRGANLKDTNLMAAKLINADLSNSYIVGARLQGVDMTGANLAGSVIRGVQYNTNTIWPEGFDKSRLSA